MAASSHSRAWLPGVLFAACAAATAAVPYDASAPIDLQAASSDFDYRNNTLLFRRVVLTQGQLRVEATEARATGLNFENSEWNLTGQVRITVPEGRLAADSATVTFKDNQVARAVIRGNPATFEQRLERTGELAQGRGGSIEYDVRNSTVRLLGDAWLTDGRNEIRGDTLVYDIGRQRVAANPGKSEPGGVRITINPRENAAKDKAAPRTPKAPAESPAEPAPSPAPERRP